MQNQTITMDRLAQLRGADVYDETGQKIGAVDEIFYDDATHEPEWIGVGTGFFGTKRVLVPVQGATIGDDALTVPFGKGTVKDSPHVSGSDGVDEETERELYRHYGLQPSERRSESVLPEERTSAPGSSGADRQTGLEHRDERSMTRSEEELKVGKRDVETGQVRLRKWVETEPVEQQVSLERETVHVNREPIDRPASGAEIGEDEISTTLHAEESVVEKRAVARERVSLDKDVDQRTETVGGEVRKERIDVEGDPDAGRRGA